MSVRVHSLTISQLAQEVGVPEEQVRNWIQNGAFPSYIDEAPPGYESKRRVPFVYLLVARELAAGKSIEEAREKHRADLLRYERSSA